MPVTLEIDDAHTALGSYPSKKYMEYDK